MLRQLGRGAFNSLSWFGVVLLLHISATVFDCYSDFFQLNAFSTGATVSSSKHSAERGYSSWLARPELEPFRNSGFGAYKCKRDYGHAKVYHGTVLAQDG
jgi:hypothetical protein